MVFDYSNVELKRVNSGSRDGHGVTPIAIFVSLSFLPFPEYEMDTNNTMNAKKSRRFMCKTAENGGYPFRLRLQTYVSYVFHLQSKCRPAK